METVRQPLEHRPLLLQLQRREHHQHDQRCGGVLGVSAGFSWWVASQPGPAGGETPSKGWGKSWARVCGDVGRAQGDARKGEVPSSPRESLTLAGPQDLR